MLRASWWPCWSGSLALLLVAQLYQGEALPRFEFETSDLFGHDSGDNAAPFCLDMDSDGDADCLVGTADGFVLYFQNQRSSAASSHSSWEQRFTNYFAHDVGTDAAPFCGDFDGDSTTDCLVGNGDGLVAHFVQEEDGMWKLKNSSVFGVDFGSSAKPFCTDLDSDGLVDCLVGAADGYIYFMKRQSGSSPSFTDEGRFFSARNFGQETSVSCVDVDGNGMMECLVGSLGGFVTLMERESNGTWVERSTNIFNRGFGTRSTPFCVDFDKTLGCLVGEASGLVSLMTQTMSGYPHFIYEGIALTPAGTYAVPSCADLDGNGAIECVVGDGNGAVEYFGHAGSGLQMVRLSTSLFSTNLLTGRAAPTCFDVDGDGAADCLVGDGGGRVHHFHYYGVGWSHSNADFLASDVGSQAKPFCANMSGVMNCLVGNLDGKVWHYRQTAPLTFELISEDYFRFDVGEDAAPSCSDLDHDGYLDCLVGESGGYVVHFRNTSTGWVHTSNDFFKRDFGAYAAPFCGDIEGDGRMDCLVGSYSGSVVHMRAREAGAPEFTWEVPNALPDIGMTANPFCLDMDDDGELECVMGTDTGRVMLFKRNSSAARLTFTEESADLFPDDDSGTFSVPLCFDMDGDGDVDCLVGNFEGVVHHFRRDGENWIHASPDYFSLDVGSYAAPFCVDMDGDGDIDCLVGNYNGLVHYWRKDEASWHYVTGNFFQYDVGGHAVPFCADMDGDGDMDCLVGEAGGAVVQFKNEGSPSSFHWTVVTRNYFNIAAPYAAPFCFDFDEDGDMDCLVGRQDGHTFTFRAQTAYTPACTLGSYLLDGVCTQCVAGKRGVRNSNLVLTCEDCPEGTTSDAGSTICRQTFVDWVKSLSTVHVSSEHNGHGLLDMRIHVPPLPSDLHEGMTLAYTADLQGSGAVVGQQNSSCTSLWQTHPAELKLSMTFEQIGLDCTMDIEVRGAATVLTGHAELAVRAVNDGNRVVKIVGMPLELHMPRHLNAAYDIGAHMPTNAPKYVQPLAPFVSSIKVFQSSTYDGAMAVPFFQEGDTIYVMHSTDAGSSWKMTILSCWLSNSTDPNHHEALVANLTDNMTLLTSPTGQVRFSFLAVPCPECVLHVVSQLVPASGRLLSSQIVLARTSLALQIVAKTTTKPAELFGTLNLAVEDPALFATNPASQQAVASAIREVLALPPEVSVVVGLRPTSPGFLSPNAHSVVATYLIIIPAGALGDGRTADDIVLTITDFTYTTMSVAVRQAVGSETVSVVGKSEVTFVKRDPGEHTVVSGPNDGSASGLLNVVVMIVGIGVGVMACCVFLCRQWFKRRLRKPFSSFQDESNSNNNNNAAFSLIKVADRGLLARLNELFMPVEMRSSRKKVLSPRGKMNSKFVVKAAWSVHAPELQAAYEAKKADIACQRQQIDETKGPQRTDPTPVLTDDVAVKLGVNTSCNEKLLLYGAKVNEVESILCSGLGECSEAEARFGFGVYLAEDAAKIDENAQADHPLVEDGDKKHLHRLLYGKQPDHPGEVYYAFICQASLGCPIYTKGPTNPRTPTSVCGPTNSCEEGIPVFDSALQRELTSIPGTSPRIPYNSLIVEKGRDSVAKLHREFVLFDTNAVLVKYLVAYAREDGPINVLGSV